MTTHIPNFDVRNNRQLVYAECSNIPPIMIVTGPNGCGKSTLLQSLKERSSVINGERPIYLGPHRSSRRQHVQFRFLDRQINLQQLYSLPSLQHFDGINLATTERSPWDHDEAASFIKPRLCQLEVERQNALVARFDSTGSLDKDEIPDIWEPLHALTHTLLPHLAFDKIDMSNRQQMQCLWRTHRTAVDIDQLSSGEKSVIQLFLPLIEHQIQAKLSLLSGVQTSIPSKPTCIIIDEPEIHLHPNLQAKILDYMRSLVSSEGFQFIVATQSPTMVEHANSSELFLLKPPELVEEGANQFAPIATDETKLQTLRDLFGSTSNITALRPIVVVEGARAERDSKRASDSHIFTLIDRRFGGVTLLSGGGKTECKRLADQLRRLFSGVAKDLTVHALTDCDLEEKEPEAFTINLPVSMIENFFVDPTVIWGVISVFQPKTPLNSISDVEDALDAILDKIEPFEVARRIKNEVGLQSFRLVDPVERWSEQVAMFVKSFESQLNPETMAEMLRRAKAEVAEIKKANRRREAYNGKEILNEFYRTYLHSTGMGRDIFIYHCAAQAASRRSVRAFVDKFFGRVGSS